MRKLFKRKSPDSKGMQWKSNVQTCKVDRKPHTYTLGGRACQATDYSCSQVNIWMYCINC